MLKWVGESRHPFNCCSEPNSCAAVEEDCTGGLVIEVFGLGYGWRWCCSSSWLPTQMHDRGLRRPSLNLWRHGRGLAGVGNIYHTGFLGWRAVLWCSFLLWSLPALQRWSSLPVASICSVRSSAWRSLGERSLIHYSLTSFASVHEDQGLWHVVDLC